MEDSANIYLVSLVILIFISALFACSETSIIAASRPKIHRLANNGDRRAKKLEKLLENREKVIGTMLAGNNAINILASSIATTLFIKFFGEAGMLYATIIMTILILVFAEIAPKTIAIRNPDIIALLLTDIICFLVKIFSPFTVVAQKIVDVTIDFFAFKKQKKSKTSNFEEIRDTVDLKAKEGTIFKYDKDLIDGVLDLSDTEITEIMVHRKDLQSINIDLSKAEIINKALKINHTRIPLWREDKENIVAILNVRKLLKALHLYNRDIEKFDLSEALSKPWFVPSTNSLRSQLFAFRKKKKRFALVIDEYGSLLGLVTLEDILEEIVGDIKERDENAEINIVRTKSGFYKIAGKTLIRDINKKLEWDIVENDHAYNLAALVIEKLGRIPDEKEHFVSDGYYFEILKKQGHDLLWIKIKKLKQQE